MKLRDRMVVCGALLCATVTAAQADTAKLPNPSLCSVPCGICLVGCAGGAADPAGTFSVVVRDYPNHPIAYAFVVVDFSPCCGDIRLADTQLYPGMHLDPVARTVTAFTDATGTATFSIMGAGRGAAAGTEGQARVFADGYQLTSQWPGEPHPNVTVAAFDLDGASGGGSPGVGPSDLAALLSDAFSGYRARSDYDFQAAGCTGSLTPADLSRWLQVFFDAGSSSNAPSIACP